MAQAELTPDQQRRVERTAPKVPTIARGLVGRIGHLSFDDLVSAGHEGLVQAALRYDPESGVPFSAFAHYRIRGAMIDAARQALPEARRRSRALRVLETTQALLREASDSRLAVAPHTRTLEERVQAASELLARTTTALLVSKAQPKDPDTVSAVQPDAETHLLREETRGAVRDAIAGLAERDRDLVEALYFRGWSMHEYGRRVGKNASTVSRQHARIIDQLGKRLRRAKGDP